MAQNPYYNIGQDQGGQDQVSVLADLYARKSAFNQQVADQAATAQAQQQQQTKENWWQPMIQGGMAGAAFGPYGAAIGAGLGGIYGGIRALRKDDTPGGLESAMSPIFAPSNFQGTTQLAGALGKMQQQSTAQTTGMGGTPSAGGGGGGDPQGFKFSGDRTLRPPTRY